MELKLRKKDIDIIIPSAHRTEQLQRLLYSIAKFVPCKDRINIIIVEDCSPYYFSKVPIVEWFKNTFDILFIHNESQQGPGGSRHIGLQQAVSDFVLFMDDDDTICYDIVTLLDKDADIISTMSFHNGSLYVRPETVAASLNSLIFKREFIEGIDYPIQHLVHGQEDAVLRVLSFLKTTNIKMDHEHIFYDRCSEESFYSNWYLDYPYPLKSDLFDLTLFVSHLLYFCSTNDVEIKNKNTLARLIIWSAGQLIILSNEPQSYMGTESYYIFLSWIRYLLKYADIDTIDLIRKNSRNNADIGKLVLEILKSTKLTGGVLEFIVSAMDLQFHMVDEQGISIWANMWKKMSKECTIFIPYIELARTWSYHYYEHQVVLNGKNGTPGDNNQR